MIEWEQVEKSLRVDEALDALGFVESYKRNHQIFCSCQLPSHAGADVKPSFNVNEDSFLWNCFACLEGGKFPSLVMSMLGLDWDAAVAWLIPFSDASSDEDVAFLKQVDAWLSKPESLTMRGRGTDLPFFSEAVLEPYRGLGGHFWVAVRSLGGRELSWSTMEVFKLGFDYEHERGDYIGPAALIPHYFQNRLVGYQERWTEFGTPGFPDGIPKYTNSRDFPRKETLFNYDSTRCSFHPVCVVESPMTVFRLYQLDVPAVATFGASISDQQLRLMTGFYNGIIVSFDNDDAGDKATSRILKLCDDIPVSVVPPPRGVKADLGDLDDEQILAQLDLAEPGFLWTPNP